MGLTFFMVPFTNMDGFVFFAGTGILTDSQLDRKQNSISDPLSNFRELIQKDLIIHLLLRLTKQNKHVFFESSRHPNLYFSKLIQGDTLLNTSSALLLSCWDLQVSRCLKSIPRLLYF